MKDKIIGVFIDGTNIDYGPGRLAKNTITGLERYGISYKINDYGDFNICLAYGKYEEFFSKHTIPNSIIGPCGSGNHPSGNPNMYNLYDRILVASEWYKNMFNTQAPYTKGKVKTWFGGIDTENFKPEKNIKYDFLISEKNRGGDEVKKITDILDKNNLTYLNINYGSNSESEMKRKINECRMGIILHNTETQGFAIMQMMSMGLPLLVLDKNVWQNGFPEATSVPYFDETCGIKILEKDINNLELLEEKILEINNKKESYDPRRFIVNNYTIEKSTDLLIKHFLEEW